MHNRSTLLYIWNNTANQLYPRIKEKLKNVSYELRNITEIRVGKNHKLSIKDFAKAKNNWDTVLYLGGWSSMMAKGHSLTERKHDAQKLEARLYKKLVQA